LPGGLEYYPNTPNALKPPMFNIFVTTLDYAVAGLIGMGIVMGVKEARRRVAN